MNREIKARWVQKLDSSEYQQTKGTLNRTFEADWSHTVTNQDGSTDEEISRQPEGYCCLGVLCEVLVEMFPDAFKWDVEHDEGREFLAWKPDEYAYTGYGQINLISELEGLASLPGIDLTSDAQDTLIVMNDGFQTFPAISEWIKKNVGEDDTPLPVQDLVVP